MRFETKIYNYTEDEKVIGAEVIIYNEEGDKIKSITVVDENQIQALEEALESIDSRYVLSTELTEILENEGETTEINATLLNGYQGDSFLLRDERDTLSFKPKSHSSSGTEYGAASTSNYGHVKLRDDLTASNYNSAEALSSHQGKVLNDSINALSTISKQSLHSQFKLVKRNGVVQLTIGDADGWDGETWIAGRTGRWIKIFDIPQGYRPTSPGGDVKNIYCPNLFGYHLRVRINTTNNEIQVYSDGSDNKPFFGTVTWITED